MRKILMAALFAAFLVPLAAHANMNEWKEKDTNGDGMISKSEFEAYNDKKFEAMDANHDGNVTKAEAKAYHESMPHRAWDKTKAKAHEMKEDMKNNNSPATDSSKAGTTEKY
jgi:Ca2+-binding EF-hand superfamily protein